MNHFRIKKVYFNLGNNKKEKQIKKENKALKYFEAESIATPQI
jgi:hypothetical protein